MTNPKPSLESLLRLTHYEPDSTEKLQELATTYEKDVGNYLLQSKYNQNILNFKNRNSTSKDSVNSGIQSIKRTFQDIKSTVGAYNVASDVDWDTWEIVVDNYETYVNEHCNELNELICQGIPDEIRGIIWQLTALSKDPNLEDFYHQLKTEPSIHEKSIQRDLRRTSFFTNINKVNKCDELLNVIKAYTLYDPDVGYTQGMLFIAVPLSLNMSESECFTLFTTLMKEYNLRELFCPGMRGLHALLYSFDRLLEEYSPILYNHLIRQGIKSSMYATQWFLTFFAYRFPLDMVLSIFDVLITEGIESILKFAVNIMLQNESTLLNLSFDKLLSFLKEGVFLNIDNLVHESLKINLDPVQLEKYHNEFDQLEKYEKMKLEEIDSKKVENGSLRNEIKHLELDFVSIKKDHLDVVQNMVDLKITLPELQNENMELEDSISVLKEDIENLEKKIGSDIPTTIEEEIKKLLEINAKEVDKSANLEEELERLQLKAEKLKKQMPSSWFKW